MLKKVTALIAAAAMAASVPAAAQTSLPSDTRAAAEASDANELGRFGGGGIWAALVGGAIIVLIILAVLDDDDEDNLPTSP